MNKQEIIELIKDDMDFYVTQYKKLVVSNPYDHNDCFVWFLMNDFLIDNTEKNRKMLAEVLTTMQFLRSVV